MLTNPVRKDNQYFENKITEGYAILTNKQVVSIPLYWIIFRAELSGIYHDITSVDFSIGHTRHYRAIYKPLRFYNLKRNSLPSALAKPSSFTKKNILVGLFPRVIMTNQNN